jgi:hypothetical protein
MGTIGAFLIDLSIEGRTIVSQATTVYASPCSASAIAENASEYAADDLPADLPANGASRTLDELLPGTGTGAAGATTQEIANAIQ